MKNQQQIKFYLLAALIVMLGGCSNFRDDWGDETTQATAVGGAMGAGLGAILGSQTGSAGTGLVIGGLAGAGAGAAVGSALQERNNDLIAQEEVIERQQQRISANSRALAQMKGARDGRDGASQGVSSLASHGANNHGSRENVALNPMSAGQRARYAAADAKLGRRSAYAAATWEHPARRIESPSAALRARQIEGVKVFTPATVKTSEIFASSLAEREITEKEALTPAESAALSVTQVEPIAKILDNAGFNHEGDLQEKTLQEKSFSINDAVGSSTGAIVAGLQQKPQLDDECLIADGELNLAAKAAAPADKLFHQRKALRLCPNTARYHIAIAETYQSLNRRSDAEFELREALRLDPQNASAQAKLKGLK